MVDPLSTIPIIDPKMLLWLIPLMIWEAVWKLIALWKSAKRNQLGWFIVIAIVNTLGILPIIYLLIYREKNANVSKKGKK